MAGHVARFSFIIAKSPSMTGSTADEPALFQFYGKTSAGTAAVSNANNSDNSAVIQDTDNAADDDRQRSINQWIADLLAAEVQRIANAGSPKPIQLAVTRSSMEIDWSRPTMPQATNRLEVQTRFPFDRVRQILVSEPVICPTDAELHYVHLVLFTDKPLPLIMPYVYRAKYRASPPSPTENDNATKGANENAHDVSVGETGAANTPLPSSLKSRKILVRNKLDRWAFVNSLGQVSRHRIDQFDEI